ncbi:MAG: hypothetical protein M0C28_06115 [Candidatus Moduliflexus flocculans]|nr:hypothetical protein [Candidatus Moduliflexus flocculans]
MSFYMKQYMDSPHLRDHPQDRGGREREGRAPQRLFTDRMLEITEGTMVAADIGLDYIQDGRSVRTTRNEPIRLLDRNAMAWFDDRCAAAYVTAKDPAILSFAKNVTGSVKEILNTSVNRISRRPSPSTKPSTSTASATSSIQSPLTPRPRRARKRWTSSSSRARPWNTARAIATTSPSSSPPSSNLSSIETAFITVPGHIFMAFNLDARPEEARRVFSRADELIMREDKTWLPLEITDRSGGFLKAWQAGAKEWQRGPGPGTSRLRSRPRGMEGASSPPACRGLRPLSLRHRATP